MANQHVVPNNGQWQVKRQGSEKATKNFETQKQAIDYARSIAIKQQSELVIHLLEYQHKKEQKEKRIARQDELVRDVKKSHKISGEEIVRKEIPGLERTSMTWMRDMIYGRGA